MEQSPQNPGAPAQGSAVQGSPLPENTAQSNAVQENTVQNNAAESTTVEATAVPTATALQSPAQDPAVDGVASAAPAEAVAPAPAEPKRMGLYSLICLLVAVPLGASIGGIPLMWLYLTYTTGPNATLLIIASIIIWCASPSPTVHSSPGLPKQSPLASYPGHSLSANAHERWHSIQSSSPLSFFV